jgi:hypothetical protein
MTRAAALALALAFGVVFAGMGFTAAAPASAQASALHGEGRARDGAARANCVASPGRCGYPGAANTGVPAGTRLRAVPGQVSSGPGWYFDPRGWVEVYRNGAVLSDLYIRYNLDISASDVTVKDVKVETAGRSSFGVSVRHARDVTIEDCTISGRNTGTGRLMAGVKDIYGDSAGLAVLRDNIRDASTGVQMESGLVEGVYIHDMGYIAGDHINGVTSNGGVRARLTIRHNTILADHDQTDAIGLFEDFGVQTNRVIDDNLLAGGGYAIYGGQDTGGPATSKIVVTGNRISTMYYPHGGRYGPVAAFNSRGRGNVWFGNVWSHTGNTIHAR